MIILTPALKMKIFLPLNTMLTIRMQDQSLLVTMICNNYLLSCEINELLTFHLYKSNHTYVWPMCYLSVILLFPAKQRFISSTGIIEDSSLHTLAQESSFQSQNWHFFYFVCYSTFYCECCNVQKLYFCVSYTWYKYLVPKEDRLSFCINLEVVNLEIKNPTFVFWEKLWLNNFVSRLTDL